MTTTSARPADVLPGTTPQRPTSLRTWHEPAGVLEPLAPLPRPHVVLGADADAPWGGTAR